MKVKNIVQLWTLLLELGVICERWEDMNGVVSGKKVFYDKLKLTCERKTHRSVN